MILILMIIIILLKNINKYNVRVTGCSRDKDSFVIADQEQ